MAFNFLGNNPYQVKYGVDPYEQQTIYNDPRRQGSVGSFNPNALEFYGQMKGGMTPPVTQGTKPPLGPPQVPPPGVPQIPTVPNGQTNPPPTNQPSSTYYTQPSNPNFQGTPYSGNDGPNAYGNKPGAPSGSTPGGNLNYAAFPSVQAAYASFPGGTPPAGWDWQEWARVNNAPDPARHTASGEPITFTWNPNGGGYINPQTGQTYDRYGETVPR